MTALFSQKVLLVFDDEADEAMALHILRKYNFANTLESMGAFSTARNYLTSFAPGPHNREPELILLFYSNSPQNQMDLAKRSRENASLKSVPLIVVIGTPETEAEFRDLKLPLTYCLRKPLGFFKLLEALQKLGIQWLILNRERST